MECKNCQKQTNWIFEEGEIRCANCQKKYSLLPVRLFTSQLFEGLPGNVFDWYITLHSVPALHDTHKLQEFAERKAPYILQSEMTALALFNTIKANEALILAKDEQERHKLALEIIDVLEKTYFVSHDDAQSLVFAYESALNNSRIFTDAKELAQPLPKKQNQKVNRRKKPQKIRKERKKLSFQLFLKPVIFLLSALIAVSGIYLVWQWSLFSQKQPAQEKIVLKNKSLSGKDFESALETYKNVTIENCDLEKISEIHIKKPAVTSLSIISCKNISDLSWLEECINIQNLTLTGSNISGDLLKELSLKNLIQLEHANFSENTLNSLQFLKNCSALVTLDVSKNQIEDLKGIRFLKNLNVLNISNNELTTLDTLQSESQNFNLNASFNKIRDIQSSPMIFETMNLDGNPLSMQAVSVLLECRGNSLILNGEETPFVFARNSQIDLFSILQDNQFENVIFNCESEKDAAFIQEFGIENSHADIDTQE